MAAKSERMDDRRPLAVGKVELLAFRFLLHTLGLFCISVYTPKLCKCVRLINIGINQLNTRCVRERHSKMVRIKPGKKLNTTKLQCVLVKGVWHRKVKGGFTLITARKSLLTFIVT